MIAQPAPDEVEELFKMLGAFGPIAGVGIGVMPDEMMHMAALIAAAEPVKGEEKSYPTFAFEMWTDYNLVVVSDGHRYGVAHLGPKENFELEKGACVALLRLMLDPTSASDPDVFKTKRLSRTSWQVETDLIHLGSLAACVGFDVALSLTKRGCLNMGRHIDQLADFPVVILGHNLDH